MATDNAVTNTADDGFEVTDLLDWIRGTATQVYQTMNPPPGYHATPTGALVPNTTSQQDTLRMVLLLAALYLVLR